MESRFGYAAFLEFPRGRSLIGIFPTHRDAVSEASLEGEAFGEHVSIDRIDLSKLRGDMEESLGNVLGYGYPTRADYLTTGIPFHGSNE